MQILIELKLTENLSLMC